MNWSQYSRYVGDIFGAPLAMEGLLAFFLESTFLGLWIFGWGRLSPKLHLATIWLTAFGTVLSAYFILAANSWMQHPVGYSTQHGHPPGRTDEHLRGADQLDRAAGLPAHDLRRAHHRRHARPRRSAAFGCCAGAASTSPPLGRAVALPFTLVAAIATMGFGHGQGTLMEKQQPMKMAAAEALYNTTKGASLSIFAVGPFERHPETPQHRHPHPAPALAASARPRWNGEVKGINQINADEQQEVRPGRLRPDRRRHLLDVPADDRRRRADAADSRCSACCCSARARSSAAAGSSGRRCSASRCPILANWTGWIFTEMGRQPWVVYGLLKTSDARSPNVGSASIIITLAGYIADLRRPDASVGGRLFLREIAARPRTEPPTPPRRAGARAPRPRRARSSPTENGADRARPQLPADPLVRPDRRPVDRLLRPRGLRLRRRHAGPRARPRRHREADDHPHDRAGLGRQRGVAADRRRRHLRRLPGLVREPLLGLLPGAVPDPRCADRPRRLVRVLGQGRLAPLARDLGVGGCRSAAAPPRCCGASAGRTSSTACR